MNALRFWLVLGMWLAAGALRAADEERPIVKMSPYEVTANSVRFERWIRVTSPHFSVYTDVSPVEAMTIVREMEMLHLAAQHFFGRAALRRAPMIFVLPATGSDWRKLESKGHVEWKVAISDPAHTVADLILAHYDWQSSGLQLVWAEVGAAECYWLSLPRPLWLERGVMGFLETAEFSKNGVTLGRASTRLWHLKERGWLPWERLFAVTEDDPEYRRDGEFQRLAAQSIVFVQFLLAHPEGVHTERLMTWSALMDAGVAPGEAEFQAVFGQNWKTWQTTMAAYLAGGSYKVKTLQFAPEALQFEILQLAAFPREMRELFILGQILNQKIPASAISLDAMLANGLQSESLREILIEACMAWKREEAVDENLGRLISANSTNPNVYALAAKRRLARQTPRITVSSRLGAEAAEIERLSRRALMLEPRNAEANNALAMALALGPEIAEADVKTLQQLYRALSGNAPTSTAVAALAIAHARLGHREAAREISEILRDSKFSDATARAIATEILGDSGGGSVAPLKTEAATTAPATVP